MSRQVKKLQPVNEWNSRDQGRTSWKFPLVVATTLFFVQFFFSVSSWSGPGIIRATARALATSFMARLAQAVAEKDLAFMEGVPGSPPETVSPNDPNALRFSFSGENDQTYYVEYPKMLEVTLGDDSSEDPDRRVRIYDLESSSQLSLGVLPSDGSLARTSLGGTRDRLLLTQESGDYTGELPLTIVYP